MLQALTRLEQINNEWLSDLVLMKYTGSSKGSFLDLRLRYCKASSYEPL